MQLKVPKVVSQAHKEICKDTDIINQKSTTIKSRPMQIIFENQLYS